MYLWWEGSISEKDKEKGSNIHRYIQSLYDLYVWMKGVKLQKDCIRYFERSSMYRWVEEKRKKKLISPGGSSQPHRGYVKVIHLAFTSFCIFISSIYKIKVCRFVLMWKIFEKKYWRNSSSRSCYDILTINPFYHSNEV